MIVRRFSAVRGVWITGEARRGVLRLRVGGRAAARGRVSLRRGDRLRGRLGGRRVNARLGRTASVASAGSARRRGFYAPSARKSSHPRLVPSPAR